MDRFTVGRSRIHHTDIMDAAETKAFETRFSTIKKAFCALLEALGEHCVYWLNFKHMTAQRSISGVCETVYLLSPELSTRSVD